MIAVALRGEVTDREPLESIEERIAVKPGHDPGRRHVNAIPAARTKMGDALNGIENAPGIILTGKHGDGD